MTIEQGYYQHYKGKIYYVMGIFIHTETQERMVAYTDLEKSWVRPLKIFIEYIDEEEKIPRFRRILHTEKCKESYSEL